MFKSWYNDHLKSIRESFLCWLVPLLNYLELIPNGEKPSRTTSYHNFANTPNVDITKDIYIYDKHTKDGRSQEKQQDFAKTGAHVENEDSSVNQEWKRFYETKDDIDKETEYPFIVRAQLVTGNSKTDTYIARDKYTNKLIFMKGPIVNYISAVENNYKLKLKFGLPTIPFHIIKLIPDRWPNKTPLGLRNRLDRKIPQTFMTFDCLLSEDEIKTKKHSSKLWPETDVLDIDDFHMTFKKELSNQEMIDYVHALLFRYLVGIGDLADRNFIRHGGRVYSIDEEKEGSCVNFMDELKKNKCKIIKEWLNSNYDSLDIHDWDYSKNYERLRVIKDKKKCIKLFSYLPEP